MVGFLELGGGAALMDPDSHWGSMIQSPWKPKL